MKWFVEQLRAMQDGGLAVTAEDIILGMENAVHQDNKAAFETAIEKIADYARRRLAKTEG